MVKLHQFLEAEFISLLFLITNYTNAITSNFHKHPCYTEGHYKFCSLEQEDICHPVYNNSSKRIESFENSAIIVRPFTHISHSGKNCNFTIKAKHKDMGLFAVIQEMNFRKTKEGHCKDFVRFKSKDKDLWSDKWCGVINRKDSESKIPHHYYSEFDPQGKLETFIFVSDEPSINEELNLSIIYTPNINDFSVGIQIQSTKQIKILEEPLKDIEFLLNGGELIYRKCSKVDITNFRKVTHDICIWKDYICDGYQNCAIDGCDDERECVGRLQSDGTGTKVTVGAVTTIFLCFILFVTCLWICKKHKKLCWSADCAGPTANRPNSNADNDRVPPPPTAPMLQSSVSSGVQDKDLPPSYDSLFPQQSNTAIL